jgi:hypothetical protein
MKKNVLIGIIVAIVVVLILGGVVAWYFLKGGNKNVEVPISKQFENVSSDLRKESGIDSVGDMFLNDLYKNLTKAQKDCLLKALGQTKLDGFLKNDAAIMQTITGDEYEKASACPQ